MTHFKPYIDHYYGPEGFGILRFMKNFSRIPTFFGLRINGFRAENTIFSKNLPRDLMLHAIWSERV